MAHVVPGKPRSALIAPITFFFAAADPLPETLPCLAAASASICLIRLFGHISFQFFSMNSRHS